MKPSTTIEFNDEALSSFIDTLNANEITVERGGHRYKLTFRVHELGQFSAFGEKRGVLEETMTLMEEVQA